MIKRPLLLGVILVLSVWGGVPGTVSEGFSDKANPSPDGRWTYGWKKELRGEFRRFLKPFAVNWWNAPVTGWSESGEGPQHGDHCCPFVGRNRSGKAILGTGARVEKDDVWFHPGPAGEYAVVRYTCQSPGPHRVEAKFYGGGDGSTDVHVMKNNTEIWAGAIGGKGQAREYRNAGLACFANDVIEFAVGVGADRVHYGDITGLQVRIGLR